MSQKPTSSEQAGLSAESEMGETVEFILGDGRVEAFLSDRVFIIDPATRAGRMAIRAYAFALAADGKGEEAKTILNHVGREG